MSSSLAAVQAREKAIVGGKGRGCYRNKLQWDRRLFSSDWWGPRDKKRVDPWSPMPSPSPAATRAWSRLSLSRLQSSFFSEGQLDEANSLSRIPWPKLYWSPLLHVKIDIYDALHHKVFSFLGGGWRRLFVKFSSKTEANIFLFSSQDAAFFAS